MKRSEAVSVAQSNAKIVLMIALGELQCMVGPDRRVTVTAAVVTEDERRFASGF